MTIKLRFNKYCKFFVLIPSINLDWNVTGIQLEIAWLRHYLNIWFKKEPKEQDKA